MNVETKLFFGVHPVPFKTKYPKDKFLECLSESDPKSSKEIADLAGCTPNTAKTALFKLEEEGKVRKKLISGKYYVWWKELEKNRESEK